MSMTNITVIAFRSKLIGPWSEPFDVIDIPVGREVDVDVEVNKLVGEYTVPAGTGKVNRELNRVYGEPAGATFQVSGSPTVFYSEDGAVVLGLQYTARKTAQLRSHQRLHDVDPRPSRSRRILVTEFSDSGW
jgi:hypothetical protein